MELFEFTFHKGDTFKHTVCEIEKYIYKNVKVTKELSWKPEINIQIFDQNRTAMLQTGFKILNHMFPQSLYVQVYDGMTLHDHITFDITYLSDERLWQVTAIQYPAALW